MSITDELREYAGNFCGIIGETLTILTEDIEAELAERYVPLPLDAYGVPIHVGDDVVFPNGAIGKVRFLTLNDGGWLVNERGWLPSGMRHYHEPTVEDVLAEFANKVCNSGHQWGLDAADTIAEYAAKLCLKEDE